MLATFFLGPQPFGPPKMSLVLRPPVARSLILRTGYEGANPVLLMNQSFVWDFVPPYQRFFIIKSNEQLQEYTNLFQILKL